MEDKELFSIDLEQSLLGCLIVSEEQRLNLDSKLSNDLFYSTKHQEIYKIIYKLQNKNGIGVDLVTIHEEIRRMELDIAATYINNCTNKVTSPNLAESYYKRLYELHYRRELYKTSVSNKQLAEDFDKDIDEITSKAESSIFQLTTAAKKDKGYNNISENLIGHIDRLQNIDPDKKLVGIETPYEKLNKWTGGLRKGETTIIAARPKQGKTTFATNIAQFAAVERGTSVGIYSLEMTEEKLIRRMLASSANVDANKLSNGTASEKEWNRITNAATELYEAPININDSAGLSIQEIRADARKMKMNEDVELIVIDYAEKVGYDGKSDYEAQKIFKVAEEISQMNKELDVHTILISQVNRGCEQRNDKRPHMGDLKGSSGLEQEANMIAFLYRESFYNPQIPDNLRSVTELIIAAHRDGEPRKCALDFRGNYNRFEDCHPKLSEAYRNWLQQ